MKEKILVSSCLCEIKCRYNGGNVENEYISTLDKNIIIHICPEILGGLKIPRKPCEIVNGTAKDVLDGKAKITSQDGEDFTKEFIQGAEKVIELLEKNKDEYVIKKAILKQKSPSCGYGIIYDGTFSGNKKEGNGILAEMLMRKNIEIISI